MSGIRGRIIKEVQKEADTPTLKLRASEVSRVASMTIDIVIREIRMLLDRK